MYRRNSSSIEKKKKTVLREKLVNKGIEIETISQIPVEGMYNKWKSKEENHITLVRYVKEDFNVLRGIPYFLMEKHMEMGT